MNHSRRRLSDHSASTTHSSLNVKDPETAAAMRKLADDYDKLADRAVLRAAASQQPELSGPQVVTAR